MERIDADYRFSMADSEWSRDDSETDVRYITNRNIPCNHPHPMYDVPADVQERVLISTVQEGVSMESIPIEKARKSLKGSTNSTSTHQPRKENRCLICLFVYVGCLSFVMLLLVGAVTYITFNNNLMSTGNEVVRNEQAYDDNISELRNKVDELQIILETLTTELNKDCRNNLRISSTCYSIHLTPSSVQPEAVLHCKMHGRSTTLARVESPDIKEVLFRYVTNDVTLWVDGYRRNDQYYFSDGRNTSMDISANGDNLADCVSLVKHNGSATAQATDCYSNLNGYICQYPMPGST